MSPSRSLVRRMLRSLTTMAATLITLLASLLFFADLWARGRFPMQEPHIVIANALADNQHADSAVFRSLALEVALPVLLVLSIYVLMLIATQRTRIGGRRSRRLRQAVLFVPYLMLASSSFFVWHTIPVAEYLEVAGAASDSKGDTGLVASWYVDPASVPLRFPQKKRNLILIFLESMETSFQDRASGGWFDENLIPGLSALAKEHVNFSHESAKSGRIGGGMDVTGTGWTIAGLVSKTMGIPYALPGEQNPENLKTFLPHATGLFDILATAGYRQRFICGSDIRFASRDAFFATHGKVETRDWKWYRAKGKLPSPDYAVFWGFEDRFLWQFAREELDDLSAKPGPFMLSLLTVDTHFPQGYVCPECGKAHSATRLDRYKDVILCADRQASAFMDWCKKQAWYKDTTIVLVGDHLFMTSERYNIFDSPAALIPLHRTKTATNTTGHSSRRWYNLFINPAVKASKRYNRRFSSMDIYPSILEALGVRVKGHALGFGRSLFADTPTLLESVDEGVFNLELMKAGPALSSPSPGSAPTTAKSGATPP